MEMEMDMEMEVEMEMDMEMEVEMEVDMEVDMEVEMEMEMETEVGVDMEVDMEMEMEVEMEMEMEMDMEVEVEMDNMPTDSEITEREVTQEGLYAQYMGDVEKVQKMVETDADLIAEAIVANRFDQIDMMNELYPLFQRKIEDMADEDTVEEQIKQREW